MILFVILYVWQNIGVMKIKMDYRKGIGIERELAKENDRLRYEIERYKITDLIERYAASRGMRELTPDDFEVIDLRKNTK
jgi:hypothetical protein